MHKSMKKLSALFLGLLLLGGDVLGSATLVLATESVATEVVTDEEPAATEEIDSAEEGALAETPAEDPAQAEEEASIETPAEELEETTAAEEPEEASPATEETEEAPVLTEEEATVTAVGDTGITGEYYTLHVKIKGEEKALDIQKGSTVDKANVQIYKPNNSAAQLFRLEKVGDYYKIVNVKSGKVLDVAGGGKANKTNVQQYRWNGTDAQLWALEEDAATGAYHILSKASGKALDVAGGSHEDGTNVQIYSKAKKDAQRFYLTETKLPLSFVTAAKLKTQIYQGKALTPDVKLTVAGKTLKKGTDYTVTYSSNTAAGTGYVQIKGAGNYSGSKKVSFKILAAASKVTSGKTYTLIPKANTELAMDVSGGGLVNNTRLWLYKQNNSEAQKFKITKNSDGTFTVMSARNTLALDVKGGSTEDNAVLQVYNPNDTKAQKWNFRANDDGTFTVINQKSKKAIDIPKGKATAKNYLQLYRDNKTNAQKYYLIEADAVAVKYTGTYMLATRARDYMVMDAVKGGTTDGTNIQLYFGNRSAAQKFQFKYSGDDTYRIVNTKSGKVLTTKGNSSANGANIELQTWRGQKGQRFKIVARSGGYVSFQSLLGTAIDVPGANYFRGQNVQAYKANKTAAQQWKIAKPTDVPIYKGTQAADYTTIGERAYQGNAAAKQTIIKTYAAAAEEAYKTTNYPRSVLIAQAILECGWMSYHETVVGKRKWNGVSGLQPSTNNILGMNKDLGSTKWNSPWDGKFVYAAVPQSFLVSSSNPQGLRVETMRQYPDIETCFLDYARFRTAKFGAIKKGTSAASVLKTHVPGYAASSTYVDNLRRIINTYNLTQYDK